LVDSYADGKKKKKVHVWIIRSLNSQQGIMIIAGKTSYKQVDLAMTKPAEPLNARWPSSG